MKLTKKKVLVSALAVSLIAILSFGTLAWFTDTDSVTNNFKTADSDDTADEIFSIDVYEKYDSDDNGTDETYQTGINYDEVTPGSEYQKEAYVKNTGKYGQYVRVKVTLTDVKTWLASLGVTNVDGMTATDIVNANIDLTAMFKVPTDFDSKWDLEKDEITYDAAADNGTLTYFYYYKEVLQAGTEVQFLEGVVIPSTLTQAQVENMDGSFKLDILAEAIQSDNTGNTAQEAFTKF